MDIERTMFWAGLFAILFVYLAFQTISKDKDPQLEKVLEIF